VNPETKEGRIKMTRRVLTAMGSATAVAAVVGGCLLLGPTPQAQAGTICYPLNSKNCVTSSGGVLKVTSSNGSSATYNLSTFCAMATNSSGTTATYGCSP
jgi:hypothetical protein